MTKTLTATYLINGRREEIELTLPEHDEELITEAGRQDMDLLYGEIDARYDAVTRVITPWMSKVDGKVVSTWETLTIIWIDVHRLLGRRYDGPQDDSLIISRLQDLGIAPAWLDDEGTRIKTDVYGWEVISPEWPVMNAKLRLEDGRIVTTIEYVKEVLGGQAERLEEVELEEIGKEILNELMEFGEAVLLCPDRSEGDF